MAAVMNFKLMQRGSLHRHCEEQCGLARRVTKQSAFLVRTGIASRPAVASPSARNDGGVNKHDQRRKFNATYS